MKKGYRNLAPIAWLIFLGVQSASWLASDAPPTSDKPAGPTFGKDLLPFLKKHCIECHGNGKKKGGISLDKFKDDESLLRNRRVWEHIAHTIGTGEMPPKSRPRPGAEDVQGVLRSIDGILTNFDCSKARNVGRVTLRRLNRAEYNNTIRDLVGIDFKPAADFPADDVGYGFDNIGDVLTMSPLLLEKYLAAAEAVLDKAIVIVDTPKPMENRLGGLRPTRGSGEIPKKGALLLHSRGEIIGTINVEAGDYVVRAEVFATPMGAEPVQGILRVGRNDLKQFEVKSATETTIEAKMYLETGSARVAVEFLNPYSDPKNAEKKRLLHVRNLILDGPYNALPPVLPETHRKLMAHPDGLPPREAAGVIIKRFASQAFRRPVTKDEVERLLILYDKANKDGERFENAIRLALYRVLVSPHFLFRVEQDPPGIPPGNAYPVSEHALASRLSYFLWSSMPDRAMLELAEKGQLRRNQEAQFQRLLKDPRSAAFVQNFAGQWLTLRNLTNIHPDPKVFPGFDDELRQAMRKETELFFHALLSEDRSILDFLDADFSFVNERLAKHYGIPGIEGVQFRRVKMPANRGGILTHASILTLTSYPGRTSPVQRGKWVLEEILNAPPPPPPPDVPALDEEKQLKGSLRQVMEQHRVNPVCASCHQRMDAIGFAFENFDAIGRWRDKDGKYDIDPAGILPDGKAFKGPAELKAILKEKKELFARCLSEKVLTYALGRGLEYYDKCAVDKIVLALQKNDYRFSTLLVEVIKSEPFQMRTAQSVKSK